MSFRLVLLCVCLCVFVLGAGVGVGATTTLKSVQNAFTYANCLSEDIFHPAENALCRDVVPSSDLYVAVGVPMYVVVCAQDGPVGLTYQGGNGTSTQNLDMGPVVDGTVLNLTLYANGVTRNSSITSSCVPSSYPYAWNPPATIEYGGLSATCCILTWTPPTQYPQQNNIYLQIASSGQAGRPNARLTTVDPSSVGTGTGTGSSTPSSPSGTGTGSPAGTGSSPNSGTSTGTGSTLPVNGTSPSSPTGGSTPTGTGSTPSPSATSSGSNSSSTGSNSPTPTSPPRPNGAAVNVPHSVVLPTVLLVILAACLHFHLAQ